MKRPVSEIMTRDLFVIQEWENLLDVAADMERHHVRHLPVVDGHELVGLVSHRDLLRCSASELSADVSQRALEQDLRERTFVRKVMTSPVVTVSSQTSVAEAAQTMLAGRFGCLPVVDDGHLVGIVSEVDLLKLLLKLATNEIQQWQSAENSEHRSPLLNNE